MALADIRAGLVANLRGAYPRNVQVGKYVISTPTPPTLQIRTGPLNYDLAMGRGLDELFMIVQGLASLNDAGTVTTTSCRSKSESAPRPPIVAFQCARM